MTDTLQGSCILLHGPPKVGKTIVASSFPNPVLFLATESGHKYLPAGQKKLLQRLTYGIDKVKKREFVNGWDRFLYIMDAGLLEKKRPATVVLDTTGPLYQMCFDYTCQKAGVEHPEDQPHGKGWAAVKREFLKGLGMLAEQAEAINATILFISHSRQEELKAGAKTYHRIVADMTGQARGVVLPGPDHIWYLGFNPDEENSLMQFKQNRCLWLQPTAVIEAGCRDNNNHLELINPLNKTEQYDQIIRELAKHNSTQEQKVS